jgi:hypothetical protein
MPTALTLELDVQCLHCGYNLRTLELDSRCPECGQPVLQSLARRPFGTVSRRTLQRVALGLILSMLSSPLAGIAAFLAVDSGRSPALVSLYPGGDKGWLFLLAFSESPFVPPSLAVMAIVSLALHLVSVWLLTSAGVLLPGVYARRAPYRIGAIVSVAIVVYTWFNLNASLSFLGGIVAVICDLGQMILFINWAISIAQAAPYVDLETALARSHDLLIASSLLIAFAFCGACAYASAGWSVQLIVLLICIVPAAFATVSVIRLAWRIHQIQPLLAE